jgi:glycosyltransferase involved in cell wall biosynthesis
MFTKNNNDVSYCNPQQNQEEEVNDFCKISVIIPVYNAEKFLSRCLESIISQDYKNLEIICVDDGSTDESLNLINYYANKDSRIKIISQFNQGAAQARNKGIKQATGDYISFIDADDYIAQGLYSLFAKQIADGDIDIFMFNGSICDTQANVKKPHAFFSPHHFNHAILPTEIFDCKSIPALFYCSSGVWNKIYNRKFLNKNHINFIKNNHFEDVPFNFSCFCQAKKIKLTYDDYYFYMQDNPNSVTRLLKNKVFEIFDVFTDLEKSAQEAGLKDYFAYALFQFNYEKINELIHKTSPEIKKSFYKKGQNLLIQKAKHLNPNIYKKLMRYNIAHNIMHNSYEDFLGGTFLTFHQDKYADTNYKDPMFSIIVPIYNVEKYIEDCLRSILAQSYQNFEVICVDDGSPDKSIEILKKYEQLDKRIRIIQQQNKGLGGARNTGVKNSKGKYLLFVDSDDRLHPNALEKLYNQINIHPKDIYLFGFCSIREDINIFGPEELSAYLQFHKPSNWKDIIPIIFVFNTAWCKIYKREFWQKHNFEFPEKVYFEDFCLNTQILSKSSSLGFCAENLYYYRIRKDSIMQSAMTEKKIDDLFSAYNSTYAYIRNLHEFELLKKSFYPFMHSVIIHNKNKLSGSVLEKFNNQVRESSFGKDMIDYFSTADQKEIFGIYNCA